MMTNGGLRTLQDQIASQLRGELLSGQLAAGSPLREVELAARFGVSRGPIREVFHKLVQEGLLVARRNCGVAVAPSPPDSVRELVIPLRCMIETYALDVCFDDLNDADFREWEKILERMRLACVERDYGAIIERDCDFHRYALVRAGLSDVTGIWTLVHSRMRPLAERGNLRHDDPLFIHAVHADLLDVFRTAGRRVALKALREHIEDGEFNEKSRQRWRRAREKRR